MPEPKPKRKSQRTFNLVSSQEGRFESETIALQSLRLIAAPNPEDDLSDEELANFCRDSSHSSELIRHLIECIKSI